MTKKIYLGHWLTQSKFAGSKTAKRKNLIALSFDDGPHHYNTLMVIKTLNANDARGTFFWIASNAINLAKHYPKTFKKIVAEIKKNNHEIGLHAPYDYKPTLTSRLYGHFTKKEFKKAKKCIENLTSIPISLYRPHCVQLGSSILFADELGMTTVAGDFLHYARPDASADTQVKKISLAKKGSILILHDGESLLCKTNYILDVLPEVVKRLKNKGLKLTSISRMLQN